MKKFAILRTFGKCYKKADGSTVIQCEVLDRKLIGESSEYIFIDSKCVYDFDKGIWYCDNIEKRVNAKYEIDLYNKRNGRPFQYIK